MKRGIMSAMLNAQKKYAVMEFLDKNNFEYDSKNTAKDLIKKYITERNIILNKEHQKEYENFSTTFSYKTFLFNLEKYSKNNHENQSRISKSHYKNPPINQKNINLNSKYDTSKDADKIKAIIKRMELLKSISANSDSKIGWTITFLGLMVTSIITLFVHWKNLYILLALCPPVVSLVILTVQLVYKNSEETLDKELQTLYDESIRNKKIKDHDFHSDMNTLNERVFSKISKKEKWITISFCICIPIAIPFYILSRKKY